MKQLKTINNRLTNMTDSENRSAVIQYDELNQISKLIDANKGEEVGGDSGAGSGSTRDDLGFVGNKIRDKVNGELGKDLFEHYWKGSRKEYKLSTDDFNYIVNNGKLVGSPKKISYNLSVQGINCYGNKILDQGTGSGTIYIDNKSGKIVGFKNYYDFDPKKKGIRSPQAESNTRKVYYYNKFIRFGAGKPFYVIYGVTQWKKY